MNTIVWAFLGFLCGIPVSAFFAAVVWVGFSIFGGQFLPFQMYRETFALSFMMFVSLGMFYGGAYGAIIRGKS